MESFVRSRQNSLGPETTLEKEDPANNFMNSTALDSLGNNFWDSYLMPGFGSSNFGLSAGGLIDSGVSFSFFEKGVN